MNNYEINCLSDHMTNNDNETCPPGEALVVGKKVVVDFSLEKPTTNVASNFITSEGHSGEVDHKKLIIVKLL